MARGVEGRGGCGGRWRGWGGKEVGEVQERGAVGIKWGRGESSEREGGSNVPLPFFSKCKQIGGICLHQ